MGRSAEKDLSICKINVDLDDEGDFVLDVVLPYWITRAQQLESMAREWISIKDQLPENHSAVLVLFRWEDGDSAVFIRRNVHGYFGNDHKYITHWMPLPEPPK